MKTNSTNFWRGFTWKRFAILTTCWFGNYLLMDAIDLLIEHPQPELFTSKLLLKHFLKSILFGFLFSFWFEPGVDRDIWIRNKNEQTLQQ